MSALLEVCAYVIEAAVEISMRRGSWWLLGYLPVAQNVEVPNLEVRCAVRQSYQGHFKIQHTEADRYIKLTHHSWRVQ